jgi:hypothetical protein
MAENFLFPRGRGDDDLEWTGTQIGLSNIVTRARSRAAVQDEEVDAQPGRFESLLASARRAMAGRQLFIHDVVIHGVRVRAHTDSHHLADFWRRNWFGVEEWREITGARVTAAPRVNLYAFGRIEDQPEATHYSRARDAAFLFNTSYYGELRAWALASVGRVLAEGQGIHSLPAAAVSLRGRGGLLLPPEGALEAMALDSTRLHSYGAVFVRYAFPRVAGGGLVSPVAVRPVDGAPVQGSRCFEWLDSNRGHGGDAAVEVLSLSNERFELRARDLDLDRPRALAFLAEKEIYLRTNAVERHPWLAAALLAARLENVPDPAPESVDRARARVDRLVEAAPASLRRLPLEALRVSLFRLCAFDESRAMVDPRALFGEKRAAGDPFEPMEVREVSLPEADSTLDNMLRRCVRLEAAAPIGQGG